MFENLKKIRKQNNITCKQMAEKLGFKTASTYHKKENGVLSFSLIEAAIISMIFNMSIEQIFLQNDLLKKQKMCKSIIPYSLHNVNRR